jgi:hypothetical protein
VTVNRDYRRPRAAPRSARFGGRAVVFFGVVIAVVAACLLHERGAPVSVAGKAAVAAAPVREPGASAHQAAEFIEPVVNQKDYAFYDRLQQSNVVAPPAELIAADARARAAARERRKAVPAAGGRYPTRADAERRGASLSETL